MSQTSELPRWDLEPLFPSLDSKEFNDAWSGLSQRLDCLEALFVKHQVGQRAFQESDKAAFNEIVSAINQFYEAWTPISAFIYAHVTTDSANTLAQAKLSEMDQLQLRYQKLKPRLTPWLAGLDTDRVQAGRYQILIDEAKVQAAHMMSEAEEVLAAELALSGGTAFARLHSNLSSQISALVNGEELPMAAVRNLAFSPDESVRKAAYQAELGAWKANEVALAAALNGWKGQQCTLNRKRGWSNDLEPTLHANRITEQSLEAMISAMKQSLPAWRRYFLAKAKALGKPKLDWWDLFAPLSGSTQGWSWLEARKFIAEKLATFSQSNGGLAERAFAERWIDAEPRKGKVGGAYCMPVGKGQSRILSNYQPTFDAVSTLAHELGHAYHNLQLARVPAILRDLPMTLAETASIMNQTIVVQAALEELPENERLVVLEADLQDTAQVIVDIYSRFLFEQTVFAKRKERELSPEEFRDFMLEAQKEAYGDALASYHPYMWAVKGHYYGIDFYNYPYAFGLLFSLALYQQYQQQGAAFVERYDDLLSAVGTYPAKELAARFGFDLEARAFWDLGIGVLTERIARFERLVG